MHGKVPLYSACHDRILLFSPLTTFVWSGCPCWPLTGLPVAHHHHLLMLVVPPNKEDYFVCLLAVAFLYATVRVLSLSLPIPYGMHLVVPTHPCFLWVVCHPSKTFPPKSLSRNPKIGFPLSLPLDYALLPLTYDLTTSCISWVQAGDVWALCILHFHEHPKSACCSRVHHGLKACLHILPPILGFL